MSCFYILHCKKFDLKSYINTSHQTVLYRSRHQRYSIKKDVLRNFTKLIRDHLCQSFFFNKVTGRRPATLLKKTSGTGVFL